MRHLNSTELKYAMKLEPDMTIKRYCEICNELEEDELAIANSQGIPDEVQKRVEYGKLMYQNSGRSTIWTKII